MPSVPYWRGSMWICPNHIPSARFSAITEECLYTNCKAPRPDLSTRPEEVVLARVPQDPPPNMKRRGATLAMNCSRCGVLVWRRPSEADRKVLCKDCFRPKK